MQHVIPGLESDAVGDFNFYLGDMNYRLMTNFKDLNNTNVREYAVQMISSHDQLKLAQSLGYFPCYEEQPIDFLPTYKMSNKEELYVNKKDQAPSYCDRILFKNNLPVNWTSDFYRSLPHIHGSDHRPVQLGITLN